jgi:alpha-galactosidase/6-phospho-beta-glucosidase family protein
MIYRIANRLSDEHSSHLELEKTLIREEALEDADFVINTGQVGGHDWTEAQRLLAEEHGYYRGLRLHDFGQMEFMLEVARDIERICPEAWLIQSSNPVFEGCMTSDYYFSRLTTIIIPVFSTSICLWSIGLLCRIFFGVISGPAVGKSLFL